MFYYLYMDIPVKLKSVLAASIEGELHSLPDVRSCVRRKHGKASLYYRYDGHLYKSDTARGAGLRPAAERREILQRRLSSLNIRKDMKCTPVSPKTRFIRQGFALDRNYYDSLTSVSPVRAQGRYQYKGVFFRSKSEKEIAEIYSDLGFDYIYEPEIILGGTPFHPDFAVWCDAIGGMFFHEHFGLMDTSNYRRSAQLKIGEFIDSGFIPGMDFLATYENNNSPWDKEGFLYDVTGLIIKRLHL